MKALLNPALFAVMALLIPALGYGQDVYIRFDSTCMDRLEYAYGFTAPGAEYVKYQVQISPTEHMVLEVGPENSAQVQQGMSDPTIQCGDIRLNAELADNIREGRTKAFMLRPLQNDQFAVLRINQASYFRRDAEGVTYESWQFSFSHQGGLSVGENLTQDNIQGVNVFFQGPTTYQCADAFIFRQTFQFASPDAFREIIFVPSIGIVEERPANGDANNIYQLKRINGQPFDEYLQAKCGEGIQASNDFLLTEGGQSPQPTATDITPFQPQPQAAAPATHMVVAGETLFAISRQHNVGVGELQSWNHLGSSTTIKVGQELIVSDPALAGPSAVAAYSSGQQPAWRTTTGTHTAQSGETVAMLATMYGYTEARFRDMNNLADGQTISPGMVLKTTDCPSSPQNQISPAKQDGTLPADEPITQGNQLPAPFSSDFDTVDANAQADAGASAARGNEQAFVPPVSGGQPTLPTNTRAENTQGGIQPFNPSSTQNQGTLPTNNQSTSRGQPQPFVPPSEDTNSPTLPTTSGNNSQGNTLPTNSSAPAQGAIQPFQPPAAGGEQPLTPFTPPSQPTTTPAENPATLPEPATRPPSSSFGVPVQTSSSGAATSYRWVPGPGYLSINKNPVHLG